MFTRTFVQSQPDPSDDDTFYIHSSDVKARVQHGWDPGSVPVRYTLLFPVGFKPNMLPTAYQLNYTMGLGSG
jgi:hypothetical protein